MQTRIVLVTWLMTGALGLALADTVSGQEPHSLSVLAEVKGLEKRITYTETKIPLGELVAKAAADTGVPLTATPEVADEPVAVVVTDLPARDLLQEVADLLDYRWRRRFPKGQAPALNTPDPAPSFEIYQDLAARNRETALRERQRREVEARFQEELKRSAAMAALPADAFQRLLTAAADRRRQASTAPSGSPSLSAEAREQEQRDEAVHSLQSPVQRTLALLIQQMPAEQWQHLLTAGQLTFSTKPGPEEVPFPTDIEQRLRASGPTYRTQGWWLETPTAEDEDDNREEDQQWQAAWTAAGGYRATLELDPQAFQWHSSLNLETRAEPIRGPEPLAPADLLSPIRRGFSPGMMFNLSSTPFDTRDPDEELTPEQRVALAKDSVFGATAEYRPERPSSPKGGPPAAEKSFQEYLPELARLYHVSFLADAYWDAPRLASSALPTEPTPLYALLARLMSPTQRWDRRDRLVRLRSRTWFMERPCEVPLRLVRQWKNRAARDGALSLDTFATCAAALSDGQIDFLNYLIEVAGLTKDFAMVPAGRQWLRFYATLTSGQRQALWQDRPVLLAHLTPAQRTLMLAGLGEGYRETGSMVKPEYLASATVSLQEKPLIRVRQQRGNAIIEQEFTAGAPELALAGGSSETTLSASGPAKAVTITRFPVALVSLRIAYSGGWTGPPPLIVSPP
jgi:hypothetical protein